MVNAEAQNPHTFWHYKNPTANCQVFVTMCLTGNRSYFVVSPELLSFVNQDAYSLLAKTPELSKYALNSAPVTAENRVPPGIISGPRIEKMTILDEN